MSRSATLLAEVTVTQRLISLAADRYELSALFGGFGTDGQPDTGTYSYPRLAATVLAAAAGLAWRGLQTRDVVGIHAPDAVSYVLATHAVRAAGGVPSPLAAGLSIAELAGQLAESGARMLITAPPLAETALALADRSWVRQVFSFADAAGTTPFSDLLGLGMLRPGRGRPDDVALLPFSRGKDDRLRPTPVTQIELADQVGWIGERTGISQHDVVLAGPPAGDGVAYTTLIDGALLSGATVIAAPVQELAKAAAAHQGTVAVVPRGATVQLPEHVRIFEVG